MCTLRPAPVKYRSSFVGAFSLAFALLKIRRLFISLLLVPVLFGLSIVVIQAIGSIAYIGLVNERSKEYGERITTGGASEFLRKFLFGTEAAPQEVKICRWTSTGPQDESCKPKPIDIILQVDRPSDFDAAPFVATFQGATQRLHLCNRCDGEFRISVGSDGTRTRITSFRGLAVLMLADSERFIQLSRYLVEAHAERERIDDLQGDVEFSPPGLTSPIIFSDARNVMVLTLNASLTAAIILWLALRSHRKVLDYFAKNDVLLPLIASCGKRIVYHSLWVLTLARVIVFVVGAIVPLAIVMAALQKTTSQLLVSVSFLSLFCWGLTVLVGLSALGTMVSIGELKQRYPLASLIHKVFPFFLWVMGSILWFIAILEGGREWEIIAAIITSLPIAGLTPILIAPMGSFSPGMLAAHAVLACILTWFALRYNARWFGAHVEEV